VPKEQDMQAVLFQQLSTDKNVLMRYWQGPLKNCNFAANIFIMKFLLQLIISTLAVLITAYLLPHVSIEGNSFVTALIVAAVLAFLNAVVKPIMIILTIPVTILSFGLFLLVINALIIIFASKLVDGFKVDNFWWALLFSLILSVVTSLLEGIRKKDETDREI
jgi:putative membrane protein